MAVKVYFADGKDQTYPDATAASLAEPLFRISKWNPKRRKLEDVTVFRADQVARAEVLNHGVVAEIILGRGHRKPN
jgi:hypothetical protein